MEREAEQNRKKRPGRLLLRGLLLLIPCLIGLMTCMKKRSVEPQPFEDASLNCWECHNGDESYIPLDSFHLAHVSEPFDDGSICADCHIVPRSIGASGHLDSGFPAEVTFGELARNWGELEPRWEQGRCTNVYCHGPTLPGGTNPEPCKNVESGGGEACIDVACQSCHALASVDSHRLEIDDCSLCHPGYEVESPAPERHINGVIDVGWPIHPEQPACGGCHRLPPDACQAPQEVECSQCHPRSTPQAEFHINGDLDLL